MLKRFIISLLCLSLIFVFALCNPTFAAEGKAKVQTKSTPPSNKIVGISPVTIKLKQGSPATLPKTVKAKTTTGTINAQVAWKSGGFTTAKPGKYKLLGIVKGYAKNIELTIIVEKYILSIDTLSAKIKQHDAFTLPGTIQIRYSDNSFGLCPIIWNEKADTNKAGIFTFWGTVKGYDQKVTFILDVFSYIVNVDNLTTSIKHNEAFALPQTVKVKMSDSTEETREITWSKKLDSSVVGKVLIEGTVDDYVNKIIYEITVNNFIKSIKEPEFTVKQDEKFVFPRSLKCTMSTGEEIEAPVIWDNSTLDTSKQGKYILTGVVNGYSQKASMLVNIISNDLTVDEIKAKKTAIFTIKTYDHHKLFKNLGTGFVLSADGIAVTTYHILEGAQSATITFENGNSYELDYLLGYNKDKDIAILKLKMATGLPFLKLGSSQNVKTNDSVVAIGNHNGMINFVTTGFVLEANRKANEQLGECVQFAAGITYATSGGALFNMKGEAIGMLDSYAYLNYAVMADSIKTCLKMNSVIDLDDIMLLNDEQKFELELEKQFSNIEVEGANYHTSAIYLEKVGDDIVAKLKYIQDDYDFFNNRIFLASNYNIRTAYSNQIVSLFNEIKRRYINSSIMIIIEGEKTFDSRPYERFRSISYDANLGLWRGSNVFATCGDTSYTTVLFSWFN